MIVEYLSNHLEYLTIQALKMNADYFSISEIINGYKQSDTKKSSGRNRFRSG